MTTLRTLASIAALCTPLLAQQPVARIAQQPVARIAQQTVPKLDVHVDPRIELVTIAARLAGFSEFNMKSSASTYADDVERQFGPLREHAAIQTLRELRRERGVSYDAIASLAVHLGPLPELAERIPFDQKPERLDQRWGLEGAREFVAELRDFAVQSKAQDFFDAHRELYSTTERRLLERVGPSKAIPWFDGFFGARAGAKYTAIPGLLCGGGNYGAGVRFADGTPEEFTPVFGCWKFDDAGVPTFDDEYLPLLIHELCHSYTNPFVDHFASELQSAGDRIYATCSKAMGRQGYGNARTVLYETLVRASTVRCRFAIEGKEAAEEQARDEVAKHFAWVPELAKLFGDYEADRAKYPTFDAFMPRVVAFLEAHAARLEEAAAKSPVLVSIEPVSGSSDVDPALATMTLHFDRAMLDQGWSFVGSKSDTPEITGKLSYDAERRVLTVPVKLRAGAKYRFSLNSDKFQGFKSADGIPLAPVEVEFATRG
jgi:hypothetical protein